MRFAVGLGEFTDRTEPNDSYANCMVGRVVLEAENERRRGLRANYNTHKSLRLWRCAYASQRKPRDLGNFLQCFQLR